MIEDSQLQQLITALGEDFELTGEEIADVLWLAVQRLKYNGTVTEIPTTESEEKPWWSKLINLIIQIGNSIKTNKKQSQAASSVQSPATVIEQETTVPLYPETPSSVTTAPSKVLPIRVPDAPSLREPLQVAQSLRPLMRKIASGRKVILDEIATAKRIAEHKIYLPIVKPETEPWLDLALVIDESQSMAIWRHTIEDLKRLVQNYGVFRDVRIWGLVTDETGEVKLLPRIGTKGKEQRLANPRELIDPNGRRLILVVSDCVSRLWYDGAIIPPLQAWSQRQPLAILQMLPDWLWLRTGLGNGASVLFKSLAPGVANQKLEVEELLLRKDFALSEGIKIPVLTLDPDLAYLWSEMVSGKSEAVTSGFVLPPQLESDEKSLPETEVAQLDAAGRITRFRQTASPIARKLAGLLAAAPVINLPVVRLIQDTLLPRSNQVHVAEVFLGGLLKPLIVIEADTNPDTVQYDFMDDGIRQIFLKDAPVSDSAEVFDAVSQYVAQKLNKSLKEFVALLKAPGEDTEQGISAFAEVAIKVLEGLGGEYARFAEENLVKISSVPNINTGDGNSQEGIKAQLSTYTFEVATILIRLGFNICTLVPKEQIKHQLSLEEINLIEKHHSEASGTPNGYQSYKELSNSAQEGTDYRIETHQGITDAVIIAPHGGKIEPGATEIAKAIAGEDHGFYSLEGLKPGNNHILSIPSEKFDEPRALEMVEKANRVIAIHGFFYGGDQDIQLGGLDADLKQKIKANLEREGFKPQESGSTLEAENPHNICNRGQTGKGVQIGIYWGLRKRLFDSLKNENTNEPTLYHRFVQAIRDALSPLEAAGWRSQITQGEADYYTEDLGDGVELDMISIPGGSFMMGTKEEEIERLVKKFDWEYFRAEKPQHEVTVQPFFMGKYPITQAQYQQVMGKNPSNFKGDERPVEEVSWDEAVEFCQKLSKQTGKEYRLPSEAEWEYACRAGTTTAFHFGETITDKLANYNAGQIYAGEPKGEYRGETTSVGKFPPNAFGLYDMHGNVWEWCEDDWHENYQGAPTDGSARVSETSNNKVVRGGSWSDYPHNCRSAIRINGSRDLRINSIGVRVVCVAPRTT